MVPPVQSAVLGAVVVAGEAGGPLPTCPPQRPLELPVTVKPPLAPVVFKIIPLAAPFAEMLRNVSPLAPIVVLTTLRAVPVVLLMVFVAPVTLIVPPPVSSVRGTSTKPS